MLQFLGVGDRFHMQHGNAPEDKQAARMLSTMMLLMCVGVLIGPENEAVEWWVGMASIVQTMCVS